ncbi:DNA-directed RNA polymerase III subunit RPC8 isoform X2 [Ovis aries]|uniref:DNA-directed RNA polymerase III subunit RPC8 isoform X2 n=1 Tax=Ovis aries TaxID=9940 RepID=UPI001C2EF593|nr:DNA-directed RNA polymerase III subunit RPC8 isoform X2 [Ovis aries]
MFVLVEMVDTVRIPPWQFERKLNDSIAEELNKKLANKVVYNVGLCICLFDITKLEDAYVFPGDGASHTKVHFRYVVFHPFLDEILIGKIKGCSPEGVHVSLGFFDDILIPPESLQQPAKLYPPRRRGRAGVGVGVRDGGGRPRSVHGHRRGGPLPGGGRELRGHIPHGTQLG